MNALMAGLTEVIELNMITIFDAHELEVGFVTVMKSQSGSQSEISVAHVRIAKNRCEGLER